MRTLAVDENNDIYIAEGLLAIAEGLQAVMQACEQAVKAQFREMVLNYNEGVPTRETIWTSSVNVALYEAYLRTAILGVTGVTSIENLDIDLRDNTAFYIAEIKTIYGEGVLNNGI